MQEISYKGLLEHWGRMHNPTIKKTMCQYRAAVWYVNEKQQKEAESFVKELEGRIGGKVHSAIEPVTRFYRAEEYHQNFITKQRW